jgi:hypothetical protein
MRSATILAASLLLTAVAANSAHARLPGPSPIPIPGPIVIPADDCAKPVDYSKSFPFGSTQSDGMGVNWSIGFEGRLSLIADCNKLEARASTGPTLTVFDAITVKPMDIRLSAFTDKTGLNGIEASAYAFGIELYSKPLAQTTQALYYRKSVGFSLPANELSGSWSGGGSRGPAEASFMASYNTVANTSAYVLLRASASSGIQARVIGTASASSRVSVSGSAEAYGISVDLNSSFDLDLLRHGNFSAMAAARPIDGVWTAQANAGAYVDDALAGWFGVKIAGSRYTIFELEPTDWSDSYSKKKTFTKPF